MRLSFDDLESMKSDIEITSNPNIAVIIIEITAITMFCFKSSIFLVIALWFLHEETHDDHNTRYNENDHGHDQDEEK